MQELDARIARTSYDEALTSIGNMLIARPELPARAMRNLIAFEIVEAMRRGEHDVEVLSITAIKLFLESADR